MDRWMMLVMALYSLFPTFRHALLTRQIRADALRPSSRDCFIRPHINTSPSFTVRPRPSRRIIHVEAMLLCFGFQLHAHLLQFTVLSSSMATTDKLPVNHLDH